MLAPVLRAVPDVENLRDVILQTIDDNLGRAVQLARSFNIRTRSAKAGKTLEPRDAVKYRLGDLAGCFGVVLLKVCNDGFELLDGVGGPPDTRHE